MQPGHAEPERDSALYEQAPCGLLVTDVNGTILRINATFCRWVGYEAGELLGKRLSTLLTMGGRLFHQTHWVPLLQIQGSIAEVKLDVLHRQGHTVPMLFNAQVRKQGDEVRHEIGTMVVNDRHAYERELLIARKKAEQALAAQREAQTELERSRDALALADRRKDEFLATLAHELRNPLSPIRNALDLIRTAGADPERQSRLWSIVDRQARVLSHLVDDLLDISRIAGGKVPLRKQTLLVADALQQAIEAAEPIILAAQHRLSVTPPEADMAVQADPVRLQQIVSNLLTNAAKYTPPGGHIDIRAERDGDAVQITVSDTGVGIPAQHLETVFEMFSQLTPALERSQGGLGIGLALVRGLVHLHGGTIEARSAGEGLGSQFIVRLPLTTASPRPDPAASLPAEAPAPASERRSRVVLVDDNEDALESLALLLESVGWEVHAATDGTSGLELILSVQPDAVLLDIGLPGMSGYDVARGVRQREKEKRTLLIALSGWGQEQDKQAAALAGFDHHLTKPVDFAALSALLTAGSRR
ncbi:ATP-binding protein [Cupriavidus sp. AU9028]|uniref:hybrid sensor histidine kinase/response regulator n=1 Tax=Cupriavidus sp. AU9028 TaxID=2871157 RepID=UPI001C986D81|nr:response regulator [Cupriavidus sp. AU9028]